VHGQGDEQLGDAGSVRPRRRPISPPMPANGLSPPHELLRISPSLAPIALRVPISLVSVVTEYRMSLALRCRRPLVRSPRSPSEVVIRLSAR